MPRYQVILENCNYDRVLTNRICSVLNISVPSDQVDYSPKFKELMKQYCTWDWTPGIVIDNRILVEEMSTIANSIQELIKTHQYLTDGNDPYISHKNEIKETLIKIAEKVFNFRDHAYLFIASTKIPELDSIHQDTWEFMVSRGSVKDWHFAILEFNDIIRRNNIEDVFINQLARTIQNSYAYKKLTLPTTPD